MDSDIRQNDTFTYVISIQIKVLLNTWVANDIFTFVCHSERSEESQAMWYQRLVRFLTSFRNDRGKIMSFLFK